MMIPNVVDSEGIYLVDESGKRYLDLESGVWCTPLGHKNQRINDSIKKQIDSIMHTGFCYSASIVQEAAESVLKITNFSGGKCVFLCSGSEAIEYSRQIAKQITGKTLSMTLHDSYLGSYSSVINRTEGWYQFNWEVCATCQKNQVCDSSCETLQAIPENISEFIFEPGSSSGLVKFPPKPVIQNIVDIVRGNNGKIIINEVTTGIGRTGKWFGYHHYDIEPDIVAMGKGIGNGYPVSSVAIHQTIVSALDKSTFKYMQSHQNDPLGAAIAKEVIQVIQDYGLITKAEEKGTKFLLQLNSLVDGINVLAVRGRGLMFAIELVDEHMGNDIYNALIDRGYIVCNRGSILRIDPPLIITNSEFEEFIEVFRVLLTTI